MTLETIAPLSDEPIIKSFAAAISIHTFNCNILKFYRLSAHSPSLIHSIPVTIFQASQLLHSSMTTGISSMSQMEEALARIHRESKEQTGQLDLRGLLSEEVPRELFKLTHLRGLFFGGGRRQFGDRILETAPRLNGLQPWWRLKLIANGILNLGSMDQLRELHHLDFSDTRVSDLNVLSSLKQLQHLNCKGTWISNLDALSRLTQLQQFDCSETGANDLGALSDMKQLQLLDCAFTQVKDLGALSRLTQLRQLNCSGTEIRDLSPLSGLTELRQLNCSGTAVSDLGPLSSLTQLQLLNCSGTGINHLSPLSSLTQLQLLDCSHTLVGDLGPISGLKQLLHLNCSGTGVGHLAPLSDLKQLQHLNCSDTGVGHLGSLSDLTQLQHLNCSGAGLDDLSPLSRLTQLQHLNCSRTGAKDLDPLSGLTQLKHLNCSSCPLMSLPNTVLWLPSLSRLILANVSIPGWPRAGVLSSGRDDNCLARVRAHVDDLLAGAATDPRVKLLILGNGGTGKTQIANWLRDPAYQLDPDWKHTHGIRILRVRMEGDPPLTLSVWDFGGQDIYHGAHALFLNTPALLLLIWARDTEARPGYGERELWYRDYPLPYWLALVRHQAHSLSPVLMAQNKCDTLADRIRYFPADEAALDALPYPTPNLYVSVDARTGREALCAELRTAADWLSDPARTGLPVVGTGRLAVCEQLEALRTEGTRLLPMTAFEDLCAEVGGISAPTHLLTWLDAEGVVFHRPGMLENQVVLDPSWALDAIYAVFDPRSGLLTKIRRQGGIFTQSLLTTGPWRRHGSDDQQLFLSMMVSCGICFLLRRRQDESGSTVSEYVAPDLLPERAAVEGRLPARWSMALPAREAVFTYPLLHGGLIRTILSHIGADAGEDALYWRGGVCGYETKFRSRFLIEQEMDGEWGGRIRLRTQEGDAEGLLFRLVAMMEKTEALVGLRGERPVTAAKMRNETLSDPLNFGREPKLGPNWFVSYAWGDQSEAGRAREEAVDALCEAAVERGITIQRDRDILRPGDSITDFMGRIGAGDRIFVVMSEKYLKSPRCMHELHAVWRRSHDDVEFIKRVRLWALHDATIWEPEDWVHWSRHWFTQYKKLSSSLKPGEPISLLGESGMRRLKRMESFYTSVADILEALSDHVQLLEWEVFLEYGLRE